MAVLDLLIRLIKKMPFEHKVVYSFWAVLLSTFIASLVSVFVSCRPFKKYWQIHPDPGEWYVDILVPVGIAGRKLTGIVLSETPG